MNMKSLNQTLCYWRIFFVKEHHLSKFPSFRNHTFLISLNIQRTCTHIIIIYVTFCFTFTCSWNVESFLKLRENWCELGRSEQHSKMWTTKEFGMKCLDTTNLEGWMKPHNNTSINNHTSKLVPITTLVVGLKKIFLNIACNKRLGCSSNDLKNAKAKIVTLCWIFMSLEGLNNAVKCESQRNVV